MYNAINKKIHAWVLFITGKQAFMVTKSPGDLFGSLMLRFYSVYVLEMK